ncbi:sugar ABC transporter permease [Sporanaerobium hydrogeniformans]|uniref:Sugar ABC transporter permease n=1 Tax=Sporanaerobium hydrogeniformans TaxID=3072179 RepID=A0AC61DGB2_9FIRM|nr:ABC transporter permease [Sporanaerobium hydrogeniformans]PHV72012.1 sugar ABC transporter permease [Sporanaerobium hydrogeniformans]
MNKKGLVSLISVLLGLIAGAIFMLITGHNPLEGFKSLIQGGTLNLERIGNTIATATPLILTGLSVAFAFRTGLFNIGTPGQMLFGGFCATAVGLTYNLPSGLLVPLMVFVAFLGGALWAFIPGILKALFNVHEVVSSIMMNWIAYWVVYYTIQGYFKGNMETESRLLADTATLRAPWLSNLFGGSYLNLGIFVAILAVIIIAFILNKTAFGYELKSVGFNRHAAEYAGISVNKNIILSMMIAGGLAGLAGVVQYAGNANNIQIGVMPSQGFDGIAVALLGANTPIGALLSALFFGLLYSGRGFMSAMTGVPPEIADTIIATIIYFAATSILVERLLDKFVKSRKEKKTQSAALTGGAVSSTDNKDENYGFMPPNSSDSSKNNAKKGDE